MKYTAGALNDIATTLWFCLRTQPKREHIAAESLRRQLGLPCFSPRIRFRRATRRGSNWFVEAMFPGYIFAQFLYTDFHRRVRTTPGIVSLVRFGDYVPVLEPEVIEMLRQASSDDEVITIAPQLKAGDAVQVIEGPFHGLTALVTQLHPARERVRILLEFLGRQIETEMPVDRVLRSGSARSAIRT